MSTYFSRAFNDIEGVIEDAREALPSYVDTLVGTGMSGAVAIPQIARALGMNFALIRKPNESTHSHLTIEGSVGSYWVFVDDFIESGDTYRRVIAAMSAKCNSEHVGSWTYQYRDGFQHAQPDDSALNTFESPIFYA